MEKTDVIWSQWIIYSLIIIFILFANVAFGQIEAKHFNAEWNNNNNVTWFMDLNECRTKGHTDIAKNPDDAKKYKIAVVPTIIIFKDGEEALRFQADLSFKMIATKEEVQEAIDELLMSDF